VCASNVRAQRIRTGRAQRAEHLRATHRMTAGNAPAMNGTGGSRSTWPGRTIPVLGERGSNDLPDVPESSKNGCRRVRRGDGPDSYGLGFLRPVRFRLHGLNRVPFQLRSRHCRRILRSERAIATAAGAAMPQRVRRPAVAVSGGTNSQAGEPGWPPPRQRGPGRPACRDGKAQACSRGVRPSPKWSSVAGGCAARRPSPRPGSREFTSVRSGVIVTNVRQRALVKQHEDLGESDEDHHAPHP
jgi:hypothetical protein